MHETLETTIQKPHQLEDGTHVIPIHRVRFSGCESYKAATGVVHWNMERGVSFNINFPDVHQFDLSSYWQPAANFAGVGRFSPHSQVPSWTAETAEGHAVRLYGTCDKPTSRIHYGTNGSGHSSSVSGSVMFAEINLPASNPLSFFNATLPHPRMLFIGYGIRQSPYRSVRISASGLFWVIPAVVDARSPEDGTLSPATVSRSAGNRSIGDRDSGSGLEFRSDSDGMC